MIYMLSQHIGGRFASGVEQSLFLLGQVLACYLGVYDAK
jgi:hypothetical protein